MSASEDT